MCTRDHRALSCPLFFACRFLYVFAAKMLATHLATVRLDKYLQPLGDLGVEDVENLHDLTDEDIQSLGMTKLERNRLKSLLESLKPTVSNSPELETVQTDPLKPCDEQHTAQPNPPDKEGYEQATIQQSPPVQRGQATIADSSPTASNGIVQVAQSSPPPSSTVMPIITEETNAGATVARCCGATIFAIITLVISILLAVVGAIIVFTLPNPFASILGGACAILLGIIIAVQGCVAGACGACRAEANGCGGLMIASWILYGVAWLIVIGATVWGFTYIGWAIPPRILGSAAFIVFLVSEVMFAVDIA